MQYYSVIEIFGINRDDYPHYLASFTLDPKQGKLKQFETTKYLNSAIKFYASSEQEEAYELMKEIKTLIPSLECNLRQEFIKLVDPYEF